MIKGLTDEYPTLTTFFDGEIISEKYPFLTRKWEADEEIDRYLFIVLCNIRCMTFLHFVENTGIASIVSLVIQKRSIVIILIINNSKILITFL